MRGREIGCDHTLAQLKNKECSGLGFANITASLFGGIAKAA